MELQPQQKIMLYSRVDIQTTKAREAKQRWREALSGVYDRAGWAK